MVHHQLDRAARLDHQREGQEDHERGDDRGEDRVGDGQREQPAGRDILHRRDGDVGIRLGAGIDQGARSGLAGMGDGRRAAAKEEADDLPRRIAAIDDREAEQRPAQRPDEAVHRIPRAIDPGDLVGEEFGKGANRRGAEHPIVGQYVE